MQGGGTMTTDRTEAKQWAKLIGEHIRSTGNPAFHITLERGRFRDEGPDPVLCEVTGEPIKQSAKRSGKQIKGRVKRAFCSALASSRSRTRPGAEPSRRRGTDREVRRQRVLDEDVDEEQAARLHPRRDAPQQLLRRRPLVTGAAPVLGF